MLDQKVATCDPTPLRPRLLQQGLDAPCSGMILNIKECLSSLETKLQEKKDKVRKIRHYKQNLSFCLNLPPSPHQPNKELN